MRALIGFFVAAFVIVGALYFFNNYMNDGMDTQPNLNATSTSPVTITPIEHATAVIMWGDTVVYLDPTGGAEAFAGQPAPTFILVTDIHGDHFSTSTLSAVRGDAILIVPQAVQDQLPDELKARTAVLANGETTVQGGISIEAVPMYNVPESDDTFHTKGRGNGYVLERDGFRLYIAGDTSNTPELRAMRDIDVALVPMNLPFTMSIDDAAEAVLAFKPKSVYPYHFRGRDGLSDVNRFKQLVNAGDPAIDVVLADWYPAQ